MKYQEVKKILGITVAAGALSLSGCANKDAVETTAPVAVETVVEEPKEVKDTTTTSGFLDNTQETQVTEKVAEREVKVIYESSATGIDTQMVKGDEQAKFIVKDYVAQEFFELIKETYTAFSYNSDDNTLHYGDYTVSTECDMDEEGHLLVQNLNIGISEPIIPVVKYLKTDDNEATAMYVEAVRDENAISGITFVMDIADDGSLEVIDALGIFGESLATEKVKIYEGGKFVGWSTSENANKVDFEAGDELLVSAGINLYPIFSFETTEIEEIDGKEVYQIGKGPNGGYYLKDADGNITIMSVKTGKNVDKDKVKEVQDNKNKKDKDTTKKDKTDKDTTKKDKDKTGDKSADESKPKPDTSNDGNGALQDDYDREAALANLAAEGVIIIDGPKPGTFNGAAANVGTIGRWE